MTNPPSRKPEIAGLNIAIYGTLWIISLTILVAFPLGLGAAIYLQEYAPKNRLTNILQINISNLAGVPSVVYGLLGSGYLRQWLGLGRVVLSGALTMALLSLPVIIISSQEALKAIPWSLREAAYGVGATRWQVTVSHVLPAAFPAILTGVILAVSRAIGETAPLLVAGAAGFVTQRPERVYGLIHDHSNHDLRVDGPTANRVSRPCCGRNHRADCHSPVAQFRGDRAAAAV